MQGGLKERWFSDAVRNVIEDVDGNISSTKPVRSMEFHTVNYETLRAEKSV
jgi:FlaG/FlaF family flagellin (archaellin)